MLGVCAGGAGSTATLLLLLLHLLLLWMWLLLSVLHLDGLPLLLCHTLSLKHHLGVRLWLLVTLHGHSLLALHLLHLRHLGWVVHLRLHHLLLVRLHAVLWHLHASLWRPVACARSRSVAITVGVLAILHGMGAWSAWCLALSWLSWSGLLHHGSLVLAVSLVLRPESDITYSAPWVVLTGHLRHLLCQCLVPIRTNPAKLRGCLGLLMDDWVVGLLGLRALCCGSGLLLSLRLTFLGKLPHRIQDSEVPVVPSSFDPAGHRRASPRRLASRILLCHLLLSDDPRRGIDAAAVRAEVRCLLHVGWEALQLDPALKALPWCPSLGS